MTNPTLNYDEERGKQYSYRGTLTSNGELAGTCCVRLSPLYHYINGNHVWLTIDDLFVFPKFQGNGCERLMIEKMLEFAKRNQLGILKNHRSNHPTEYSSKLIKLLLEMGFKKHDDKYLYHTFDGGQVQ